MITLIHGTDIVASRKFFLDEKEKYPDAPIFDGEKITLTDLAQIFDGGGLFEEQKTIFIERLFNRKKGRKIKTDTTKSDFELLVEYLEKQKNHTIFLWEGKELEKSGLLAIKTAVPRVFKLPQTLFALLDSIKPGNGKHLIKLFHQTIETTDPEMIFFMLIRQIRLLLALSDTETEQAIDEVKRLAPWQKTKLQQQANLFDTNQLKDLYNNLFSLELGQKTGTLSNSILTSIDFLLLEI